MGRSLNTSSRRRWGQTLGLAGLTAWSDPLGSRARATPGTETRGGERSLGRARSLIYLFLSGGPSQYETFDPKPAAPAEIRGVFSPIATRLPGVAFCELLPRTAAIADQLTIVRSLATDDPNHESGGYWINTGHKYTGPDMRALSPTDWPTLGSVVRLLKPTERGSLTSVMLPEPIIANPNVFLPGQNGGFLGRRWDPEIFRCDPSAPNFRIDSLALPADLSESQVGERRRLLRELEGHRESESRGTGDYERLRGEALDLVLSGTGRGAFALDEERPETRERYGRGKWGQSVLLARRLVETGVRMVFVQWPREPGDLSAPNPLWDTHAHNNPRMKDVLCPQFDQGFTALIEDLATRGLLESTLVVAVGEMGRTPRFNGSGGRDHWGNVFSFVMAGGGLAGGQVHGASDASGGYPARDRVTPPDLTATLLHLLGIGHEATFPDRTGRPLRVTEGEPLWSLF